MKRNIFWELILSSNSVIFLRYIKVTRNMDAAFCITVRFRRMPLAFFYVFVSGSLWLKPRNFLDVLLHRLKLYSKNEKSPHDKFVLMKSILGTKCVPFLKSAYSIALRDVIYFAFDLANGRARQECGLNCGQFLHYIRL